MNFQVLVAVFQSDLRNLQKRPELDQKEQKNAIFWWFFEVYSNSAEKQQLKLKNSCSLRFSASFGTQLDSVSASLVEISKLMHFVYKFDNSGALYNFFRFFQNNAQGLLYLFWHLKKRVLPHIFSQKQMIFRFHSPIISLICNDFGGKKPCVDK